MIRGLVAWSRLQEGCLDKLLYCYRNSLIVKKFSYSVRLIRLDIYISNLLMQVQLVTIKQL